MVKGDGFIDKFVSGVFASISLTSFEILVFAYQMIIDAFSKTIPNESVSITSNFSFAIVVFGFIDVLQNFLVGYQYSEEFTFGFIVGDLILILFFSNLLWQNAPSIVICLISALFSVIGGFLYRFFESKNSGDNMY